MDYLFLEDGDASVVLGVLGRRIGGDRDRVHPDRDNRVLCGLYRFQHLGEELDPHRCNSSARTDGSPRRIGVRLNLRSAIQPCLAGVGSPGYGVSAGDGD